MKSLIKEGDQKLANELLDYVEVVKQPDKINLGNDNDPLNKFNDIQVHTKILKESKNKIVESSNSKVFDND